jgi:ubiquinone/menaquinone biosynthesis C-methylase UbiE
MMTNGSSRSNLAHALSRLSALAWCPDCCGEFRVEEEALVCRECGRHCQRGPAPDQGVDLLSAAAVEAQNDSDWALRQARFREWLHTHHGPEGAPGDRQFFQEFAALIRPSGTILDVGAGDGTLATFLPAEALYVGLDPEPYPCYSKLSLQRIETGRSILVRGVGDVLPFRSAVFDHVISISVINHCSRPKDFVRELVRVLKPGGRLILGLEEDFPFWWVITHGDAFTSRRAVSQSLSAALGRTRVADHIPVARNDVQRQLRSAGLRRVGTFVSGVRGEIEYCEAWEKS